MTRVPLWCQLGAIVTHQTHGRCQVVRGPRPGVRTPWVVAVRFANPPEGLDGAQTVPVAHLRPVEDDA